jgi:DNA-directed RNA polymerase specialized sigma24 family protein
MEKTASPTRSFTHDLELAESALEGDPEAVITVKELLDHPSLISSLIKRGASASEADEILGDLIGDCFGGQKAGGGLFCLLGKYNGTGPLAAFLRRAALFRLISRKRQAKDTVPVSENHDSDSPGVILASPDVHPEDDAVVDLLQNAVKHAFATADQENLVIFRLVHSYRIPQKKVAELWGWHQSKISRAMSSLILELKETILAHIQQQDPWLKLEWADFLALCSESIDLFDY